MICSEVMEKLIINRVKKITPSFFSLTLHALVIGVVAYNVKPSEAAQLPPQQMVTVTLMKAEYFEQDKPKAIVQKTAPVVKQAEVVKPKKQARPEVKPEVSEVQKVAKLETKSGAKKSADMVVTKPVFDADYLNNPPPVYPNSAKRKRQQGSVLLMVVVSEDGAAREVKLHSSSGSEILDNAAISAVSKWKFVPAKREGEFVTASVIVPIDFELR